MAIRAGTGMPCRKLKCVLKEVGDGAQIALDVDSLLLLFNQNLNSCSQALPTMFIWSSSLTSKDQSSK